MLKTARALIEARRLSHVKVGVFDLDGVLRGKYLARDKFFNALESGFKFCDVVLGWDSNDQLYDKSTFTGWHTAFPDATARICPATCRELPTEPGMLFFLGEFDDAAAQLCPRRLLKRVLNRATKMGFTVTVAAEFEFFVFDETPHSVREKNYRDLKNLTPGFFGYSVLRSSVAGGLLSRAARDVRRDGHAARRPAHRNRPRRAGSRDPYTDALEAADNAALFKTFTKVWPQRQGKMATFMAKWSNDWPGPVRPSAPVAAATPMASRHSTKAAVRAHVGHDALVRRRPAGADARTCSPWSRRPSTAIRG